MKITESKATMLFKIKPTKLKELVDFIDIDQKSMVLLTRVHHVSSGAVFEDLVSPSGMLERVS